MKNSNKYSVAAGIGIFVLAALFSVSLLSAAVDFGGMSPASSSLFYKFGKIFTGAYGVCSVCIPVFLIAAGLQCFNSKWSARNGIVLAGSVVPFFTLDALEHIIRMISASENGSVMAVKIGAVVLIGAMLIAAEFILLAILGEVVASSLKKHKNEESVFDDSENLVSDFDENPEDFISETDSDGKFDEDSKNYPFLEDEKNSEPENQNQKNEKNAENPVSDDLNQKEIDNNNIEEKSENFDEKTEDESSDDAPFDLKNDKIFNEQKKLLKDLIAVGKSEEEKKKFEQELSESDEKLNQNEEKAENPKNIESLEISEEKENTPELETEKKFAFELPEPQPQNFDGEDSEKADAEENSLENAESEKTLEDESDEIPFVVENEPAVDEETFVDEQIPVSDGDFEEPTISEPTLPEPDVVENDFVPDAPVPLSESDFSFDGHEDENKDDFDLDDENLSENVFSEDATAEENADFENSVPEKLPENPAAENSDADSEIAENSENIEKNPEIEPETNTADYEKINDIFDEMDEDAAENPVIKEKKSPEPKTEDLPDDFFDDEDDEDRSLNSVAGIDDDSSEENEENSDDFENSVPNEKENAIVQDSENESDFKSDDLKSSDFKSSGFEAESFEEPTVNDSDFTGDEANVEKKFESDETESSGFEAAEPELETQNPVPENDEFEIPDFADDEFAGSESENSESNVFSDDENQPEDENDFYDSDELSENEGFDENEDSDFESDDFKSTDLESSDFDSETDFEEPVEIENESEETDESEDENLENENFEIEDDGSDESDVAEEQFENGESSENSESVASAEIAENNSFSASQQNEVQPEKKFGSLLKKADSIVAASKISEEDRKAGITADDDPYERAKKRRIASYSISSELLNKYENGQYWIIDDETKRSGEYLTKTLKEFGIDAQVTGIRKGPVVTMFELLPAPGVKLSRIVSLQDNIALSLAASSVRIVAPIPGKHAVGIEVPNKKRAVVSFREIIEMDLPEFKKMQIPVILGKDISGEPHVIDLTKTPHLLIAGSTGSGKSVCVNSMILSILYKRSPEQVKLVLIDPKVVELKLYNDIPHLLTPVITEPKRALQALQYCLCEMERRYACLDGMGVRDIVSYNKKIVEKHIATEKLPYIVVIIDEFADLMATTGKELESAVARLAAMSRAVGIHLVLATQRPSVNVITGLIKANIPSRIAFMVASRQDSQIIIDGIGAEKLLGKGDMLYSSATDPFPTRIQGTLVGDDEVERVVNDVKQYGEPDYIDDEIFVEDEEEESSGPGLFSDGEDPLYDQALQIVVQAGKASASYIQRRLKIGYNRAARLVEEMEERGIVGPQNGSKPREVIHIP